ncbi:MAG: DUF2344 domain-containing protein [Planctomycetaceae bacterium]|nr:DUF2344 domain-containing protein [Planctomycetaceae bacterium]
MVRHRARIRFRKEGDLRLIGHHDLMHVWERLFRRAGWQLRMSTGFHPRPRINLPSALALGVIGLDEVLEVEFDTASGAWAPLPQPAELIASIVAHAPPGLGINSLELVDPEGPLAEIGRVSFELPVPEERCEALAARLAQVLSAPTCLIDRGGDRPVQDVRPWLDELVLADQRLRMSVRVTREGSVRPRDLLALLGLADLESQGFVLARTRVELRP